MSVSFTNIVLDSMAKSPEFRALLHQGALDCIHTGDIETGRSILRDYFNKDLPDLATLDAATQSP